jgi:hypothetical protein
MPYFGVMLLMVPLSSPLFSFLRFHIIRWWFEENDGGKLEFASV